MAYKQPLSSGVQPAYDPRPPQLQHTSDAELSLLHDQLKSFGKPYGLLHILTPPSSTTPTIASLPLIPRSVRERALKQMRMLEYPSKLVSFGGVLCETYNSY